MKQFASNTIDRRELAITVCSTWNHSNGHAASFPRGGNTNLRYFERSEKSHLAPSTYTILQSQRRLLGGPSVPHGTPLPGETARCST